MPDDRLACRTTEAVSIAIFYVHEDTVIAVVPKCLFNGVPLVHHLRQ